ncbi:hypothetical protein SAMN06295933_1208 [Desulfovibrio gilichinskyi]|uniref:Uncharacterized protein n=1 Tax=Desulfovibrio gilichinskyi TaxID=1519643 RepID=A0A1X7CSM3_9BACT|nr:hypothetical protein SAMN06295933_1208 [Desulfovibrio gilichinskyi]
MCVAFSGLDGKLLSLVVLCSYRIERTEIYLMPGYCDFRFQRGPLKSGSYAGNLVALALGSSQCIRCTAEKAGLKAGASSPDVQR